MGPAVPQRKTPDRPQPSRTARGDCPQCRGPLAVMRVTGGREVDYWTMRCTRCGGIHQDVVKPAFPRSGD
jgi:uncharacterized Zn finger protein